MKICNIKADKYDPENAIVGVRKKTFPCQRLNR